MTLTPRPYQIEGRDFLAARRFALLADEMRVGKTPQAILAAHKRGAQSMLVACPAIAVPQWEQEIERWWPSGPLPRRRVVSHAGLRTLWQSGIRGAVDVFIPDECHFARNPDAQITKAIYGKDGFGRQAGAIWPLSGTPAVKHAGELWPMLRAFGYTALTYEQFCRAYCTYDWTRTKVTGTQEKKIPEVKAILAKFMLRRTRKQVRPEMDEIDFQFLAIDPVSHVDLASEDEADPSRKEVALAKALPLVEEIVACLERGDYEQTVVFGWHRDAIYAVQAGLTARGITSDCLLGGQHQTVRSAIQQNFRLRKTDVVVAQLLAAGTAIDLSAASHGYFLELDWLPANNMQAANRLVSLEKDEPVTFDICTRPGTCDDRVQKNLLRRARELATIMA